MKAIFISFNQAYYEMILSIMDRSNIRGFTFRKQCRDAAAKKANLITVAMPGQPSTQPYWPW